MQTISPPIARILHAQGNGDFIVIESKWPIRVLEVADIPECQGAKRSRVVGEPTILESLHRLQYSLIITIEIPHFVVGNLPSFSEKAEVTASYRTMVLDIGEVEITGLSILECQDSSGPLALYTYTLGVDAVPAPGLYNPTGPVDRGNGAVCPLLIQEIPDDADSMVVVKTGTTRLGQRSQQG
jgi:hypothetical protein